MSEPTILMNGQPLDEFTIPKDALIAEFITDIIGVLTSIQGELKGINKILSSQQKPTKAMKISTPVKKKIKLPDRFCPCCQKKLKANKVKQVCCSRTCARKHFYANNKVTWRVIPHEERTSKEPIKRQAELELNGNSLLRHEDVGLC